jgi:hypothetical protein
VRKLIAAAGAAFLMLVLAGAALANFTQLSTVTFTGHDAGRRTGIRSEFQSADPTAEGQKPKAATQLVITFPANTRFNLHTPLVKTCTLSDKQLTTTFGPSCPGTSQIGTGSEVTNAAPLSAAINAGLKSYVGKGNKMILVLKPQLPGAATLVIRAIVTGSKLTIPIPRLVFGQVVKGAVVSLKLNLPALGRGRNALITAGRCTAHRFVVKSHFVYADHSTLDLQSSSPCS